MDKHDWYEARHMVSYSPSSFRVCLDCGLLQVLKFSGWTDFIEIPVRENAWTKIRSLKNRSPIFRSAKNRSEAKRYSGTMLGRE